MASGSARKAGMRLSSLLSGSLASGIKSQTAAASPWSSSTGAAGELGPFGSRFASSQAVRNRMKSVKSIQKITKAMKMVAASKLRGVVSKTEKSRGLWQPFIALLGDHPGVDAKKVSILTVSTDRGLCGGINSTAVKYSKALLKLSSGPDKEVSYIIVGDKARAILQRDSKQSIALTVTETQKISISFTQASMIVDEIVKDLDFDVVRVMYNKFNSVVQFLPTVTTILSPETLIRESESGKLGDLDAYEVEGAEMKSEVLQNLSEFQFASVLYNAFLENACSEQGARMSAMDSSTRNATEMLDKLTLSYNRSRQATITTELIEIISGAAALEASN
ncbi:hypothetical protein O6H91_09G046600 [Diphasiastrum complanatum]|uniref:Uncharacterized protein n=3 Tax=Diphasiastrum complanatum TaxID=34168 RepID=A0ACC2CNR5_DIPCM|nr:hypothetical protein O6H91_09G046600 [Diphasiastrum complanatum]KAJ7543647.1 hypothetical protein O6H91_09G046600 [Diphasiastrum complanatum]KAJ7543648.1 hypothetical protein O6H91_09G046600 [Diphasiastrum complanatum]